MLAISTDDLSKAQWVRDKLSIPFPILYDPDTDVVKDYEVYNLFGDGLATASTFIIDKDGIIRWKYIGRNIYDRPHVSRVIEQLQLLEN